MRRQGNKLSALEVSRMKKPGRYGDGHGLWLQVGPSGSKSWCFCYKRQGRQHVMGLGPLYAVSLAAARVKAKQANQCLADGGDPIAIKHAALQAQKIERLKVMTFRAAALDFLQTSKIETLKNDKHRKQWRSTLEQYAFPVIGDLPLQSIDTAIVLKALLPVWKRTPETGSRLRGRIERVIDWAKPLGLFTGENPARQDLLKDHLPARQKVEHHKAMPYADVPAFVRELRDRRSMSARALEFTILTAVRTSEAIGARWSEIDLDAATWIIPASRMKAKRDHRVALSHRAVELLREVAQNAPQSGAKSPTHVFINGSGKPLSNMAMLHVLRGIAGKGYTVHGFRSAFSDWARDRTGYPRDLIEMALAHTIKDKSEAAYRRGDALDKRRRLMAEWARYIEAPAAVGDNVTALRSA
jgi:integrase